jgi:hypothetical protein
MGCKLKPLRRVADSAEFVCKISQTSLLAMGRRPGIGLKPPPSTSHTTPLPRRATRPAYAYLPLELRGGAPKSANLWCPRSFWDPDGRLPARHMRVSEAHAICGVLSAPGPAFRCRLWPGGQSAPDGDSYLVVPGGAPMRPECLACVEPSPRAPHPVPPSRTPRESAPQKDEVMRMVSAVMRVGTDSNYIRHGRASPAYAGRSLIGHGYEPSLRRAKARPSMMAFSEFRGSNLWLHPIGCPEQVRA